MTDALLALPEMADDAEPLRALPTLPPRPFTTEEIDAQRRFRGEFGEFLRWYNDFHAEHGAWAEEFRTW